MQLSLSRAFAVLGKAATLVVDRMKTHGNENVRTHAIATERVIADPEEGFDAAIHEAKRIVVLLAVPQREE